jgi:phytoene/squalene synthetase
MKETELNQSDKMEITKQAKKDIQRILDGRIQPHKNHTIFEVNLTKKTIEKAKFDRNLTITFSDAMQQKKENKSISKKQDCIYIPALNRKNVLKILERDFGLSYC